MPKQWRTYNDFSGGFNDRFNQRKIKPSEFTKLDDLITDDPLGEIRTIGALADHASADDTAAMTAGHGLFYFSHERNRAGTEAGGEEYIALCDAPNGLIDIWDLGTPGWQVSEINIRGSSNKAVYTYVDGVLRVADGGLHADARVQRWEYVSQVHFNDAAVAKDTYGSWQNSNANIRVPDADNEILIEGGATYPASGQRIHLTITTPASPAGSWPAKTYQIAMSYINLDHQESLLYAPTANNTFTTADGDSVDIDVRTVSPWVLNDMGARVYAREDGTDEEWFLLVDIDLMNGCRTKLTTNYAPWVDAGVAQDVDCDSLVIIDPSLELTYSVLNGFSSDEVSIGFDVSGALGEGYRTAVIANRRSFIGNIAIINPDSGLVEKFPDRVMYSQANKFDTYPKTWYLDVIKGDSDSVVRLESWGGTLMVFKDKTLYLVDISSPYPSKWHLLTNGSLPNRGVKHVHAVYKTPHGIVWANEFGCFLFNGGIHELTGDKISPSTWSTFITSNTILGYHPSRERLFVVNDCDAASIDAWTYGFRRGSWAKKLAIDTSGEITNFVTDYNGAMITGIKNGAAIRLMAWGDSASAIATAEGILVDDDFGNPGIVKEITAIIVTYKSSVTQTNPMEYYTNGGTSATPLTGNFTSATWAVLALTPTPFTCNSLQIGIDPNSSGTINISDITVEYREIPSQRAS